MVLAPKEQSGGGRLMGRVEVGPAEREKMRGGDAG